MIDFLGIRVQCNSRLFSENLVPTLESIEDTNHVGAMPFPQRPTIPGHGLLQHPHTHHASRWRSPSAIWLISVVTSTRKPPRNHLRVSRASLHPTVVFTALKRHSTVLGRISLIFLHPSRSVSIPKNRKWEGVLEYVHFTLLLRLLPFTVVCSHCIFPLSTG